MNEKIKAAYIRPEKYRERLFASILTREEEEKTRLEAFEDKKALGCDHCEYSFSCNYVDKEARYPDWAGGKNMCLRFSVDRLGLRGWITPGGEPFIITREAEQVLRAALHDD